MALSQGGPRHPPPTHTHPPPIPVILPPSPSRRGHLEGGKVLGEDGAVELGANLGCLRAGPVPDTLRRTCRERQAQ